jgi:hypothetical protein
MDYLIRAADQQQKRQAAEIKYLPAASSLEELIQHMIMKIISGGQTGADQAALDAAIALKIPHGGWLPKGRRTETGPLPLRYRLRESKSARYRDRTEKNILAADGTLIFSFGPLSGGSALTEALAIRHGRPFLHIDFELVGPSQAAAMVEAWLHTTQPGSVNVAGPRASSEPRIYEAVYSLLTGICWPTSSLASISAGKEEGQA